MAKEKTYDALGNEVVIDASSFDFCQKDKKIHDVKFETKATTFGKDAFKRFCKNKSSVVAAFIIGILLLMSFFVPVFNHNNITSPELRVAFLEPRVTAPDPENPGFWDGTLYYENILYDPQTEGPVDFNPRAVVKVTNVRNTTINEANQYAHGGTYIYKAKNFDESRRNYAYLQNYTAFDINTSDNYKLNIEFETELLDSNHELTEYQIVLLSGNGNSETILKDWSKDYSPLEINLSDVVSTKGREVLNKCQVRINAHKASDPIKDGVLYIKSLIISSSSEDETVIELLDDISINDANNTKNAELKATDYWQTTGETSVIGVYVTYWDFYYDGYEEKLGLIDDFVVGKSIMDQYVANGWCNYDWKVGVSSFEILNADKCPIVSVTEQKVYKDEKAGIEVNNLVTQVTMYKYLGYDKMPSFIFGTDASGYDLFKKAFNCLKTSLLLAFITSAICFTFGLIWGSISGYFGGNVDIAMERFCEILGGMPWIVMMTLAIILMGNTLVTFGMALCLTGWMGTAGRTRTQFYRFKGREYVLSARTLGSSDMRLIFKHILPNSLGTIVTGAVLMIPSTIFSESTLSYLNLGLKGVDSFGNILADNQAFIGTHPALILFPAAIISLLMISFNLFGNGLRDALNPSLKGSE